MSIPDCSSAPGLQYLFDWAKGALDFRLESVAVDFKRSEPWDALKHKFVKHAMALGNQAGGGLVLVGVAETDAALQLDGVDADHLVTYSRDVMLDWVNRFASPPLELVVATLPYDGKTFLALEVKEFRETPFVCKRRGDKNVEVGDVYVRLMRGKPESTKIQSADDLQSLLDRAAEKRATRIIQGAHRVGFIPGKTSDHQYREEAATFWKDENVSERSQHAYWTLVVHGHEYLAEKVKSLSRCREVVQGAVVRRGSRRFPWVTEESWTQGNNWVAGRSRLQYWRAYQSGQFLFVGSVPEALQPEYQQKLRADAEKHYRPTVKWSAVPGFLLLDTTLAQIWEFVSFASGLCQSGEYVSPIHIEITLNKVKGFALTVEDPFSINWYGDEHFVSDEKIGRSWEIDQPRLLGATKECAVEVCQWVLERFNCPLAQQVVEGRLVKALGHY